jgi:hypothetical protein
MQMRPGGQPVLAVRVAESIFFCENSVFIESREISGLSDGSCSSVRMSARGSIFRNFQVPIENLGSSEKRNNRPMTHKQSLNVSRMLLLEATTKVKK